MTVCVYRDGVLAADTLVSAGPLEWAHMHKISKNKRGDLAAAAGPIADIQAFLDWFDRGEEGKPPLSRKGAGMIFRKNGDVWRFDPFPAGVFGPYFAFGSGEDTAYGALFMGATAKEAVKAAIKHNNACGGKVKTLTHED